jgi:pyruvate,water dikinase
VSRGIIQHPEHLLDATPDEVALLLDGHDGTPSGEELASRAETRHRLNLEEMPLQLGEAETPPPADLLPAACARAMQATLFFMAHSNFASRQQAVKTPNGAPLEEANGRSSQAIEKRALLHGQGVSQGKYEGRARIVLAPADFEKIEAGDVLVTHTTSPAYNVLLPLLGAIVTDCGGVLCHAAIVAREFGIPGVVGTGDATSRIADGMSIIVNGEHGTVEILS